jgi:serine/threonine protein kinase
MGVGVDYAGKPWVLMERTGGDLRDLLDTGMHYVKDGQMPFHYTATIKMMMEIAQGMEDLHRCGPIYEDLKASNIFVTPLMLDSFANGLEQVLVLIYFYIKIGDYVSLDGVIGTGFWRPPEVLHALKDGVVVPIPTPAGDVYTFRMLFYELVTGNITFHGQSLLSYDMVLSGQRPELPTHMNSKMHELLHSCWQADPQQQPGWTKIKETLRVECESHPSGPDPPLYRLTELFSQKTCRHMLCLESSGSTETEESVVDQTFDGDMESVVEVENKSVGSSSTGLLEMQGVETAPAKVKKLLSIHDKAQEKVPAWIVKAG